MFQSPAIRLKARHHKFHCIAEAIQAELMTLIQIVLWGACLGALPWLAMELAGWMTSAIKIAGPMAAILAGLIPMLVRLRRVIRRGEREYRAYAGYERSAPSLNPCSGR